MTPTSRGEPERRAARPARLGAAPARADADHAARSPASAACSRSSPSSSIVVWLPIHTFDPPPSADWAPLSNQAVKGRNLFASTAATSATRATRGRRTSATPLYFLYPKVSQPGDFYGSDQSPEPARHGAHRPRPLAGVGLAPGRLAARALLRPALRGPALADAADEVALLGHAGRAADRLRGAAQRQVGPAPLRGAALLEAHRDSRTRASRRPYTGFQGAHEPIARGERQASTPPKDQLEEAPNLAQIDRGYWLSGDPLPVTEQNLLRGKEVFLDRCVGCHGPKGDGKGPGAKFMSPPPADFTDKDDACCGGDTGPGDFYYRILRGWPGTAMENFGDRLSRRRHLACRPLRQDDPERDAAQEPRARAERLHHLAALEGAPRLGEEPPEADGQRRRSTRRRSPTRSCRRPCGCFPGLAPGDSFLINDGKTPLSLRTRPPASRRSTSDLLDRAWADAEARGEQAAVRSPEGHPARPCRGSNETPADRPCRSRSRSPRSRCPRPRSRTTQPETKQSRWVMADWMMDTFFVFAGLALVAFVAAWKVGHFHELEQAARDPALRPRGGLLHARLGARRGGVGRWRCPAVTRPRTAQRVLPLPAGPPAQTDGRTATWHVDWVSLAWMWGFVVALALIADLVDLAVPQHASADRL